MAQIAEDDLVHREGTVGAAFNTAYMGIKAFPGVDQSSPSLEAITGLMILYSSRERQRESYQEIGDSVVKQLAKVITYSYSYHLNVVSRGVHHDEDLIILWLSAKSTRRLPTIIFPARGQAGEAKKAPDNRPGS